MDPQATLRLFIDALIHDEADEAHEAGKNLLNWLNKGGFSPTVSDGDFRTMLFNLMTYIETTGLNGIELSPEYCNR